MTRRPKQAVKPAATAPRKPTTKPRQPPEKPLQDKAKPRKRQKCKPKVVKADEVIVFSKVMNYVGNYLLLVGVSAVIVALAYWLMDAFD